MDAKIDKKIVVVGGSGFVGTKLLQALVDAGYSVATIDIRNPKTTLDSVSYYTYANNDFPEEVIEGTHAVINLAGAPIANRWTKSYRKIIFTSRIDTTHAIVKSIKHAERKPQILVSASAVGYYPNENNTPLKESHPADTDFLAEVCQLWESEVLLAERYGARVAILRTAHVIGAGGLIASLKPLFQKHIGGYFGNGSQRMPWISVEDLVRMYIFAIENPLSGAYNTAVESPTQKDFMKIIAAHFKSWAWPIPHFVARIVKGRMATIFKKGQNIDNTKILQAGFMFKDTDLAKTLNK